MSSGSGPYGGITVKAQLLAAKIMKAYSAQFVPKMNGNGPVWLPPNSLGSLTFSEEKPVTAVIPAPSEPQPETVTVNSGAIKPKPKRFNLDTNARLVELWRERAYWRNQRLIAEKWEKGFDKKLAEVMGDAEAIYLDGAEVGTYSKDGSFRKKAFLDEQPELAEECTTYVRQFSPDLLKQKAPKVYAEYQARTLRLKDNPVVPE